VHSAGPLASTCACVSKANDRRSSVPRNRRHPPAAHAVLFDRRHPLRDSRLHPGHPIGSPRAPWSDASMSADIYGEASMPSQIDKPGSGRSRRSKRKCKQEGEREPSAKSCGGTCAHQAFFLPLRNAELRSQSRHATYLRLRRAPSLQNAFAARRQAQAAARHASRLLYIPNGDRRRRPEKHLDRGRRWQHGARARALIHSPPSGVPLTGGAFSHRSSSRPVRAAGRRTRSARSCRSHVPGLSPNAPDEFTYTPMCARALRRCVSN
jgi:hypothetical protein